MAGVDFDRDFPQPPAAAPTGAASHIRVGYAHPERHRVDIALTHPLEVTEGEASRVIETLVVSRITAAQMIAIVEAENAPNDDKALTRCVVAAMCGEPLEVLDALWPDDAWRVAEAARPFLPVGLAASLESRALEAEEGAGA